MKCRSEWQSPATDVRIRTSRGPGFCRLTSSITSGLLTSCRTAAFIGVFSFCLCILVVHFAYQNGDGELPLPLRERVGVRGYGLSSGLNPSPGSHLSMRSDLSHKGRGVLSMRH